MLSFALKNVGLTFISKFKAFLGMGSFLVSDNVPERTTHTLAEVNVPFFVGTIIIR